MITEFSKLTCVSIDDLLGTTRVSHISAMRQMYWKLLATKGFTREQIGTMNSRNHSTITVGIKHINGLIETDLYCAEIWEKVKSIKR